MKLPHWLVGLSVAVAVTCPATARGETAEQAFARGDALLAGGGFQQALQAYATAVRAERANQQYVQQFMLVRQVVALRGGLERESDPQRRRQIAQALRSFYVSQGLLSEALAVDEEVHAKSNTATSAALLAETQLAVGKPAEAAQVLGALGPEKATAATQALLGIALARQGRMGEARKISESIPLSTSGDPGTLYSLARMHAVIGKDDEALGLLRRCFEAVPPSRLDDLKRHATQSREFAGLASTDGFARVLATKSTVSESKCSGGSSCAGCPMRGSCPKSQGQ